MKPLIANLVLTMALLAAVTSASQQQTPQQPPRPAPGRMTLSTNSIWTDDDLDAMMKKIGPGATTLAKLIEGKAADAAEAQADTLEHLFDDVEEFFDARKIQEAELWAGEATDHSHHIEDAAEDKDFAKAGERLKLLMATCEKCHAKYRERSADGTYHLKKGG